MFVFFTQDCFGLVSPANGSVVFNATTYGETADYECDTGYRLFNGSAIRTCSEGGTWNGTKPTCRRKSKIVYNFYMSYEIDFEGNQSIWTRVTSWLN